MRYLSTRDRDQAAPATLSEAILRGTAPDGGLYVPEKLPQMPADPGLGILADIASSGLSAFFEGDLLAPQLDAIVADALNFEIPVTKLQDGLHVLELFHGPTAAFKDVGARFLAACMSRIPTQDGRRTVLVATSGDTGGAVASAFFQRSGFDVVVLYPRGRVSPLQEQQLCCWGANVRTFAVEGSFDDCQRMVKEAFANQHLRRRLGLTSANSINIGRLLPQIVYYLLAARLLREESGRAPGFIVPSGNLGNVTACLMAKRVGARMGPIVLACNANRTVPEFFATGKWQPRASVNTLASAMDVGNPSNMERLLVLFPDSESLRSGLQAVSVSDEEIRATIRDADRRWGQAWCPHTATALHAHAQIPADERAPRPWVVVATAHAAKFAEVVEPLIGRPLPMPDTLADLMHRPAHAEVIAPELRSLAGALN